MVIISSRGPCPSISRKMHQRFHLLRSPILSKVGLAALIVFFPASLLGFGIPISRLFNERGSLTSEVGNVTYLGSDQNSYFASFVTPRSRLTSNKLPIPSLLFVNCNSGEFDGNAAFEPSSHKYVKSLVNEFCDQVKNNRLLHVKT